MLTMEQLKFRKSGIGGSDVASILGISPWNTALDIYQDKTSDTLYIEPESDPMYFGSLMEPIILKEFQRRNPELEVYGCSETKRREDKPWILYSPDGYVIEDGVQGIFEAKTSRFDTAWEDGVPDYYVSQVMWYMMSQGLSFAYVAVLIGGNDWRQYRIERDMGKEAEMYSACEKFWTKHVAPKSPAGLSDKSTFGELTIIFPPPNKKEVAIADTMVLGYIVSIAEANETLKNIKAAVDEDKATLIKLTGGAGKVVDNNGKTLANYIHVEPKPSLDVKRVMSEQPQLSAMYLTQRKPYRTLRVYKPKE